MLADRLLGRSLLATPQDQRIHVLRRYPGCHHLFGVVCSHWSEAVSQHHRTIEDCYSAGQHAVNHGSL